MSPNILPLSSEERAAFDAALTAVDAAERELGAFVVDTEARMASLKSAVEGARSRLGEVLVSVAERRGMEPEAVRVDDHGHLFYPAPAARRP